MPEHTPVVGDYPLDRFVGNVAIIDISDRLRPIKRFFDEHGALTVKPVDKSRVLEFLSALDFISVSDDDITTRLDRLGVGFDKLRGLLFYTGLCDYWRYRKFQSWDYIYFFGPYLTADACRLLCESGLSFVGIDTFQLEHPIINFNGDELLVVLNNEGRKFIDAKSTMIDAFSNHRALLSNDILIYENLSIPKQVVSRVLPFSGVPLHFQIPGLDDNALVRPYVVLEG
jgi:kynurenine formamidase